MELISTYTWETVFSFILDPVADTDLQQYLEHVDSTDPGPERVEACDHMLSWTGCLIRALEYMHEMRVKHRDIKASNILIKNNTIYLTDFSISKIVPDGLTTSTTGTFGPLTRACVTPEALRNDARRGCAVDIFPLACVFLEMGTVLIASRGSRERFEPLRKEHSSTVSYAENSDITTWWIWHLWSHWASIVKNSLH
jgi:serine/threonine protein kinase